MSNDKNKDRRSQLTALIGDLRARSQELQGRRPRLEADISALDASTTALAVAQQRRISLLAEGVLSDEEVNTREVDAEISAAAQAQLAAIERAEVAKAALALLGNRQSEIAREIEKATQDLRRAGGNWINA